MRKEIGVSVVIPAYNAEKTIVPVIQEVSQVLEAIQPNEILVCDDGSIDKTAEMIRKLAEDNKKLRIITHNTNQGIRNAFEDLYKNARYAYVISFPADGECKPADITKLYQERDHFDLVVGYRGIRKYKSWSRDLISYFYRLLTLLFFGLDTYDPGSIKLIKKELIEEIPIVSQSVFNEAERIIRAKRKGYKVGAIPVAYQFTKGKHSFSIKTWLGILAAFRDLVSLRFKL